MSNSWDKIFEKSAIRNDAKGLVLLLGHSLRISKKPEPLEVYYATAQ